MGTTQSDENHQQVYESSNSGSIGDTHGKKRKFVEDDEDEVIEVTKEYVELHATSAKKKKRLKQNHTPVYVKEESKVYSDVPIDVKLLSVISKADLLEKCSEIYGLSTDKTLQILLAYPPKYRQQFLTNTAGIDLESVKHLSDFNYMHIPSEVEMVEGSVQCLLSTAKNWKHDIAMILNIPVSQQFYEVLDSYKSKLISSSFLDADLVCRAKLVISVLSCISSLSSFDIDNCSSVLTLSSHIEEESSKKIYNFINTLELQLNTLNDIRMHQMKLEQKVNTVTDELAELWKDFSNQEKEIKGKFEEACSKEKTLLNQKNGIDVAISNRVTDGNLPSSLKLLTNSLGKLLDLIQSEDQSVALALKDRSSISSNIIHVIAAKGRFLTDIELLNLLLVICELSNTSVGLLSVKHVQTLETKMKLCNEALIDICDKFGRCLVNYISSQCERLNEVKNDLDKENDNLKRHVRVYGDQGAPQHRENINLLISELHDITAGIHSELQKVAQGIRSFLAKHASRIPTAAKENLATYFSCIVDNVELPDIWEKNIRSFIDQSVVQDDNVTDCNLTNGNCILM